MTWEELMHVFQQQPCLSLLLQILPYEDGRELREIMMNGQEDILWNTHEQMFRVGMELSQRFRLDVVDTLTVILRTFSKHGPHKQHEPSPEIQGTDTVMQPPLDEDDSNMSDDASDNS